jgi:hypothetical protein
MKTFTNSLSSFTLLQKVFAFLLMLCFTQALSAQESMWQDVQGEPKTTGERLIIPQKYRVVKLNVAKMQVLLNRAPMELTPEARNSSLMLELPMPDNQTQRFRVFESPTMDKELAKQFPEIKTYAGTSMSNEATTIRFDITPAGFHAMVLSSEGIIYIDPYSRGTTDYYIVYNKKDFVSKKVFSCGFKEERGLPTIDDKKTNDSPFNPNPAPPPTENNSVNRIGNCAIRTYRLALSATGEYTAFHGGTVANALAAQVTTINRVNGVYLKDFAIRMIIIANNNLIIYTNAATDPFTNGNPNSMITQNQTNTTTVIGSANYDIGHVFGTNSGGLAGLGVVCSSGNKARGVTGSAAPIGDPFDIDYVAHEIGHQFSGNHSFNNSCEGNRNNATAWEPGSGSTVMGYAGICPPDVQSNSDAFFHGGNLTEMHNFINAGGNTCASLPANTNAFPTITASTGAQTIPKGTPILLESAANDADGNGTLTYCWEQMDNQISTQAPVSTSTGGPNFRSFNPSSNSSRYMPRLSDLAVNAVTTWEVLPTVARTLNYRLVVRDNAVAGGCNDHIDVALTVDGNSGPLAVTLPNATGITWAGATNQTVTWNVANTTAAPVSCATVDILLSTDGGLTFPTALATNVPNTGTASVVAPGSATTTARVMVRGSGRAFFDISNNNFAITASSVPTVNAVANQTVCKGASTTAIIFTGSMANTVFTWTNNAPSIGVAANGVGDIASFVTTLPANAPVIATFTVTPSVGTTSGSAITFTITVNPTPTAAIAVVETSGIANNDGNICANASAQLTASGGVSYFWSTNAITPSITVTPATTATYTVTVTNSSSCTAVTSATITVLPLPTPSITGTSVICSGSSTTLTAAGGGTYLWSTGATSAAVTVSPASAATYTVTVTNASGCTASSSQTVIVNAAPTPSISGVSVICSGSSTTLTAAGGGNYAWSTGATSAAITVNPASNATYTVTVTNTAGCTATASQAVTVNPLPTPSITGTFAICSGGSTTLTAAGGGTYIWSTGATSTAITVNPSITATYTVLVTNASSCTATTSQVVTVNPLPTPNISGASVICNGSSTTLTASGGGTYAWSTGATSAAITVTPAASATYTVTVTSASGCTASSSQTVTVNGTTLNATISIIETSGAANNDGTICADASAQLTASGGTSYLWSTNAVTPLITVTPATTATYTVTVTNGSSCSAVTSATITVTPKVTPSVSIGASNNPICLGSSVTFTATPLNGGQAPQYKWFKNGNEIIGETNVTLTLSNLVNGDKIKVQLTSNALCAVNPAMSSEITMSVIPLSFPIPLVTDISCRSNADGKIVATATGGTGITYSIAPNVGTQSPSGTFNGLTPQTYTVTAMSQEGCTASNVATVGTSPLPIVDAGSNQTICQGSSTNITANCNLLYVNATLNGASQVPANASTATGIVTGTFNKVTNQLSLKVSFNGLTANASASHIHIGAVGVNGGVIVPFAGVPAAKSGTFTYTGVLSAANATALLAGNTYVNVHNASFPGGEIRGQLSTPCIANNFVWNPGALTGQTVSVSPLALTTYTVTASNTLTGCSATASVTISVDMPPVGGTLTASKNGVCNGESVQLSLTGIKGSVMQWEKQPNCTGAWLPILTTTTDLTIIPTEKICYRVKVINGVCPAAFSDVASIAVDQPAVGGTVTLASNAAITKAAICPNSLLDLKASGFTGKVLGWQSNEMTSPAWVNVPNTTGSMTLTINGSSLTMTRFYRVCICSELGLCTGIKSVAYSSAFKVSLRANCTSPAAPFIAPKEGVPSNPLTFVKAYPIPSNSRITLEIDGSTEGVTQIEVLDLTGKVVQRSTQNVFDGFNELTLDIDDLSKGLYLVKVKDSSNQAVVLKVSKM